MTHCWTFWPWPGSKHRVAVTWGGKAKELTVPSLLILPRPTQIRQRGSLSGQPPQAEATATAREKWREGFGLRKRFKPRPLLQYHGSR